MRLAPPTFTAPATNNGEDVRAGCWLLSCHGHADTLPQLVHGGDHRESERVARQLMARAIARYDIAHGMQQGGRALPSEPLLEHALLLRMLERRKQEAAKCNEARVSPR